MLSRGLDGPLCRASARIKGESGNLAIEMRRVEDTGGRFPDAETAAFGKISSMNARPTEPLTGRMLRATR
jgi:hypothetical protein